jgi:hydroxymethylpyrimidine kinase / phosphomethylpyrimidine kinase / thiamine-phosphate diphosphorylase
LRSDNLPALVSHEAAQTFRFAALQEPHMGLYAVVDSAAWVRRVLAAGVRTVQLRIKDPHQPRLREEVQDAVVASRAAGAQLFINDHWQLAIEAGAYGVHLGQEDLAAADLDALARAGLRLGVSTHSYWEVARAIALRPSYIACGPIHPTAAKPMPWLPQGNGNLAYWCRVLPLPVVAIAGMDAQRAGEAAACGAAGVAVISAITAAPDPEAAIARLQAAIAAGKHARGGAVPALPRPTLR